MLKDWVVESSSTQGAADYALGGAYGAYSTWRSQFATASVVHYIAKTLSTSPNGQKYEEGYGTLTYGSPDVLSRTTVTRSSQANAKVSWQSTDVYIVYSAPVLDILSPLVFGTGFSARPGWAQAGLRWVDWAAGIATRLIDKLYNGTADVEIGRYEGVPGIYVPSGRRPWSDAGAADKTADANSASWIYSFDNSAAARKLALPSAVTAGHGFLVGGLGRSTSFPIEIAPNGTDTIEGGAASASRYVPGGVRFDVMRDGASATWRLILLGPAVPLNARRQTVVSGPVTAAGLPNFLPATATGLSVSSQNIAPATPMVLAAAGGFGPFGPIDRLAAIVANITWSGLTNATTNYLFVDIDTAGNVTPGSTTTAPVYQQGGTYSVTNGQWTFNIVEMTGKLGNGTIASQVWRVFVGEAVTSGGNVTATVAYAYNGLYDSTFTATLPGADIYTSGNHNIGVPPVTANFIAECTTTNLGYAVGDQIRNPAGVNASFAYPLQVTVTAKTIGIKSGSTIGFAAATRPTGDLAGLTAASWKYKFIADRGW